MIKTNQLATLLSTLIIRRAHFIISEFNNLLFALTRSQIMKLIINDERTPLLTADCIRALTDGSFPLFTHTERLQELKSEGLGLFSSA